MATSRNVGIHLFVLTIAVLVAALAFIAWVPLASAEETGSCGANGDKVEYALTDDGKLTIFGEGAIADGAFEGREDITQVVIEEGVTHIGDGAFESCEFLTSVSLPQSLKSIGTGSFASCLRLGSVEIPQGVTSIGPYAFLYCVSLDAADIPKGVTAIGEASFALCISLQSITIPSSVASISEDAFSYCPSATIVVAAENATYNSGNGANAIIETETGTLLAGTANTTIPSTVTCIGGRAFAEPYGFTDELQEAGLEGLSYQQLTSIEIPDGVTYIGEAAFGGCTELMSVNIPEGVTTLGGSAFEGCQKLEAVNLPESISSIENYTFAGCAALGSIEIPVGVTYIGYNAFDGVTATIDYAGSKSQWAAITGDGKPDEPASYGVFDVVFNVNGGSEVATQYVKSGGKAVEPNPAPTKEWCEFQGWYADESLETESDFDAPITQDTTIYAKWIESCVVTFDSRGGSAVETQHVMPGGKAAEPNPAPTKDWAEFIGWFADEDLETEFDFENTTIEANTTIYAKWREQCAITFETNGGSAVETQHVWPNEKATKPVDDPTKDDCLFGGWYADAGLETPFDFDTEIAQDTTVYAKWITRCTVTFQTNGGTAVDAQLVWPGEKATEPDPAPTKEDCRFGGWYADEDRTTPFDFGASIAQNTTIYAKWITQCSVTFDSCGGSVVDAQLVWPGDLAVEPNPAPTKESREFVGWYTSKDYETAFDFANTAIGDDITLYAKWQIDSEDGAAYAKFDSGTGTLTFFRSRDEYATMQKKTYIDGEGDEQTITYYADIETTDWPASSTSAPKWHNEYRTLTRVVFEDEIAPISTAMWFYGVPYIESIEGMENLDTSNVTNMWYMFYGCSKLSELDVSHMNVSNVRRFDSMFAGCKSLTELNVSGFDTSLAESMSMMFYGCTGLTELDVSGFDTANVKDMGFMFRGCAALTALDLSSFNTSQVTDMKSMFGYCEMLSSLDVSHFDTSQVTDMQYMFQLCYNLTELDLSEWDTSKVKTMGYLFDGCSSLTSLDVSSFDTSNVESMNSMFDGCSRLPGLSVSHFDVSNVKDFNQMFIYCNALTALDLSEWDTLNAENMASMFEGCQNLVTLNMSGLDTSHVTYFSLMFKNCSRLSNLNLSGIDTSGATDMRQMFYGCSSLTSLDLSEFKTANVAYMQDMFNGCGSLAELDVSGWDTSNVTTMANMFYGCESLVSLDVSDFATSNVTDMSAMFYECKGLASLDLSSFNTSNVTTMGNMFYGCQFTALDLSGFDTSKVAYMARMFRNCDKLAELDISSFDTSKVGDIYGMLYGCSSLEAIKLGAKTQLSDNIELPVREWQLKALSEPPVRYGALGGFDGASPGWYLQGYRDLAIEGLVDAEYTGEPITQTLAVSMGNQALEADVDYTVAYADNTNAGTATVTFTGMGDWVGSTTRTFEITAKPIQPTLTLSQTEFTYNGSPQTPEVVVKNGEAKLDAGKDYEVAFPDGCQEVGTYPVNVTLKGNYSGYASSTFEIVTNETVPTLTLSQTEFTYNGGVQVPEVVVKDADGVLITSEDYDMKVTPSDGNTPSDSKDAGTYTVRVTLKSGYSGEGSAEFKIIAKAIQPTIVLAPAVFTYDGAVKIPEVTAWDGENELTEGRDYEVSIPPDSKDVGSYTVEVTLKGNYSGSASEAFEIAAMEIEPTVTLSPETFTYDGNAKAPKVTVWDGQNVLTEGEDYDVALPDGRKDVGTYTVTVTLKGIYSGSATAPFTIAKAVNTLVAKGKTVKVSASKLKSKSVKLNCKKTMKISKAKGALSYKLSSVSKKKFKKYFKVNAKTGVITVRKNLKKGTYKVKVKVKAAGTKNYKGKTEVATVTVRVK